MKNIKNLRATIKKSVVSSRDQLLNCIEKAMIDPSACHLKTQLQ